MTGFFFRRARPGDAAAILRLAQSAGLSVDPERERSLPQSRLWLAESPERGLAAFCLAWCIADEVEILDLAVHECFRRQGVARRLLRLFLEEARKLGAARAFLEVRAGNFPAVRLYQSLGFEQAGRRERYYSDGEDALLLRSCLPLPCGSTLRS